ncbi:MAG: hypothetical protein QQW96_13845 [Tychonema bourrellyi B0820]|uniref:Uncharacterized protein n=1 Tax=Tychonema bourrellyi FEM_GT703 TaxID=2040638 RepID=A0A2G4F6B8_9CYAN|nr:hypothetical protein [Tychonema bourrellyi]MDQ2098718.1 hypothetical protein [Tychonema bourrellyi B0820]PHX57300.1 hypothetical protein CP500_000505 [Tychonema bourrellyi FEM_GT703]
MTERDEQLRRLIQGVLGPSGARSQDMERLLARVPTLPRIMKSPHPDYLEALNKTLEYVRVNIKVFIIKFKVDIDREHPENLRTKFVIWFNGHLKYRILDLYRTKPLPLSLDAPVFSDIFYEKNSFLETLPDVGFNAPLLDGIESLIEKSQTDRTQRKALILELYIEQDYLQKLSGCHPKICLTCNCQTLLKAMYLTSPGERVSLKEGKIAAEKKISWRSLAKSFDLNEQTLHTHWRNRCRPLLHEILADIEKNLVEYERKFLGEKL